MQKTIYTCDICDVEVSYKREPLRSPGFIAHHKVDWVTVPRSEGDPALICVQCNDILRRARDLSIVLPAPSDTIVAGGPFTASSPS